MTDLMQQELRGGWLGIGDAYQPLDFMGAALGAYAIWAGLTGNAPRALTVALGVGLVYIHSRRFLYAPKDRAGLVRLLQSLNVTPQELTGEL
ncbi:MAG: hypothetical protein IIA11_02715 [Proteobacteria bacterium]|nr:hypothetical protein [Pseudomonadota bacterium]